MPHIYFPYGREKIGFEIEKEHLLSVLESGLGNYTPEGSPEQLIENAMRAPVGSKPLRELAEGKKNIVIIASDHTRPVPSKLMIPPMLREVRSAAPNAEITILIATGCHRGTTKDELIGKFGEDIVNSEKIVIHDCDDENNLVDIGTLPSGGRCRVNKLAYDADLLIAEGFIEPHFFAGFSGGRKSVLPGIAARETVLYNHCSEFIADRNARTGIIDGNPIHRDMLWAAKKLGLSFIVNVVLDSEKTPVFAVCGDTEQAHKAGCEFLMGLCGVRAEKADIVISTNGGYPLDQNIYQSVKGMTAAESAVKDGGVIIMLSRSDDGHGGEGFYHQLADESDIDKTLSLFMSRRRGETVPDQWQSQIFIRILKKAAVIFVSDAPDETVRALHMTPAHSLAEAFEAAIKIVGKTDYTVNAIPDGVSVMVYD